MITHGGPTGATSDVLDPKIQFWTSRGFAVLDVNYSGSTGYGRPYRDRLKGQWGIVDVEDAVGGAEAMVAAGKADPERLIIRGGSAGGYTTLAALTFHHTFKAGASYYGISDLEVLQSDTHKFEARYNDSLIGPWPAARDVYRARSPIHFTDRLSCPIILFQGLEDKVVPPNQSEMMAEAVRKKGLKVKYVDLRRRAAWVPQGGEHHSVAGGGARLLPGCVRDVDRRTARSASRCLAQRAFDRAEAGLLTDKPSGGRDSALFELKQCASSPRACRAERGLTGERRRSRSETPVRVNALQRSVS